MTDLAIRVENPITFQRLHVLTACPEPVEGFQR
jgi:hypothetical protein